MNEQYKEELLVALRQVLETVDIGRVGLARAQLDSLIKHIEQYEASGAQA